MGLLSKYGMGLLSSISNFYKKVDKAVGGILPGGSPSIFKSTTTVKNIPATNITAPKTSSPSPSSPTSGGSSSSGTKKSSSGSSGGGSSAINKILNPKGTYNPIEGSYIDSSGAAYSVAEQPKGSTITFVSQLPKGSKSNVSKAYSQSIGGSNSSSYEPLSVISAYERQKAGAVSEALGLGSASNKLTVSRQKLRTQKIRGNITALKEAQLLGLTALSTIVDFGRDIADLPQTAYNILKNPKVLTQLPKVIKEQGKQFGETLRVSPGEAFVRVGGEILLMKGTGKAIDKVSELSKAKLTKLGRSYVGEAKIGETLEIPVKGGKTVKLKVVGKIPKETLAKQTARAGTKVRAAISSQADNLISVLKKSRVVRKPIPGEEAFSKATKSLLKKFDEGKITRKQLIRLDRAIKKQGAKGLLERSFFADPSGKIRPSRLGVVKKGKSNILDYFTEDITFKKQKPQILLFNDVKVQKLPTALKSIGKKLKSGRPLTKAEANKLLEFQLKQSGKFKPIGFISGESEITLAPGEIVKKVKKVGTTVVENKRVPIIQAEPYKPTGKLKTLIADYKRGKLNKLQIKKLDKTLQKKTGFNYGLSSSPKIKAKYISIKKIGAGVLSKVKSPNKLKSYSKIKKLSYSSSKRGSSAKYQPRDSSGKFIKSSGSRSKPTSRKITSVSSPTRSPGKSRTITSYKYPKSPKSKPYRGTSPGVGTSSRPKRVSRLAYKNKSSSVKKVTKGKKLGYAIYEKRGTKKARFVKLKSAPLSRIQALDRLAYRIDNKISRRAKIVPIGKFKRLGSISRKEVNYFNKNRRKLRPYKIRKGRKIPLTQAFIEKRKYILDKPGEKAQIKLNRVAKARPRISRTVRTSRRMTRGASAKTQARDSHGRFIKRKKR